MEKDHNITDAALPPLEKNNNSKRVKRVHRERIQRQKQKDQNIVKTLEEQLRLMSQRVTDAESSASAAERSAADSSKNEKEMRERLEAARERLELADGDTVSSGTEDCIVCMAELTTTAIIPCGHTAFCGNCAETLKKRRDKCPICRGTIRTTQRLFFS